MTWTEFTDEDVIVQEGTFAFDFNASGTVYKGQAVYCNGIAMGVRVPASDLVTNPGNCLGIAAYDQTNGKPLAVYGPGNICRAEVSSSTINAGDPLVMAGEGKLDSPGTYSTENGVFCSGGVRFIALEDTTTANSIIKVMVV